MQANQTTLQQIIEGSKQYLVPLFQRAYSWTKREWEILWIDLKELCESTDTHSHFLGSLVTMPAPVTREGSVAQSLLIDGQQRLTTLFLVLAALRDVVREEEMRLSQAIDQVLLVNVFEQGDDYYKLLPTQFDRLAFCQILSSQEHGNILELSSSSRTAIQECYDFFCKKIRLYDISGNKLKDIICTRLSLVKIELEPNDDPYLVFESLNAKGKPLTQSDLIRNFIFMKVPKHEQESVYSSLWEPMEKLLEDDLTEFIRHYLIRLGDDIRKGNVYSELKRRIQNSDPSQSLKHLYRFSIHYSKLLKPEREKNSKVRYYLSRINRLEVTILYPFLLNCYDDFTSKKIKESEFIEILAILENFILRRFICDVPTRGLNRVFIRLYSATQKDQGLTGLRFVDCLKSSLQTQGYPSDSEFEKGLQTTPLYGGNRSEKGRLILEAIERNYGHKERVSFEEVSIEHIMPQILTEDWKKMLGEDAEADHELLKHTLGNLTLTGYNSEMSNAPFSKKRNFYIDSHFELNKCFDLTEIWTRQEIENRSRELCNHALKIWPYFGNTFLAKQETSTLIGSKPIGLKIGIQEYSVKTWRDVLEHTLNEAYRRDPEKFQNFLANSSLISKNPEHLRTPRQLECGVFVEVNLSAKNIYEFCCKALNTTGISQDEWNLDVQPRA